MKILFLTDNFPPETNAPAIRTWEHARIWAELGHEVVVVTGAPNFPAGRVFAGYENRLHDSSFMDGIEVVRVWTYIAANRGFLRRSLDYASFMASAFLASFAVRRPDVVVATSPQLFTAVAGWAVAAVKRRPFVFELRDLWPESVVAVDAMRRGRAILLLEKLARFLYRRADLMVPVTPAFAGHLRGLGIPDEKIRVVTNGIDLDAVESPAPAAEVRRRYGIPRDAFAAGYVGTLGLAHGLEVILEAARELRQDERFHFVLMGDGADRPLLEERAAGLGNVTFIGRQGHADALALLGAMDASLVVLRDTPVFRTVIPSKIFEAMALARPIVLGVGGEAHRIVVEECRCGLAFEPGDAAGLAGRLRQLAGDDALAAELGRRGREAVARDYQRGRLARDLLAALESVGRR